MEPPAPESALPDPSSSPPRRPSRPVVAGLVAWVAVVALLTLTPGDPGGRPEPFVCLPCGDRGTADALLNVALFVPMGAGLGLAGVGLPVVAAVGFGGSAVIEAVQALLPGRYPTASDVLFNGVGGLLGALAVGGGLAGLLTVPGVGGATGAVLALTALVATPKPPAGLLFGQHTPELGGLAVYGGRVLDARVGELGIPSRALDDSDGVRAGIAAGAPVTVVFEAGPPPASWAPVFAVFSADQEEALFVAVRGTDVLVRRRTRAGAWRLRAPGAVLSGALEGVEPGDTVALRVEVDRGGTCVAAPAASSCGLGLAVLDGWMLLLGGDGGPPPLRSLLSLLWVALPAALLCAAGGPRARRVAVGAGLAAAAVLLPVPSSLAATHLPTLLLGAALGSVLGGPVRRWTGVLRRPPSGGRIR